MKKLLFALPLIAGASWAGTTYYSGAQTEPAYNRLLEQLNNTEIFVLKSAEYKAGFTTSTAITEVRLNDETKPDVLFRLKHEINHSPVSIVPENARFGAANIITTLITDGYDNEDQAMLQFFDTGEPFVMDTDVAIDGGTTTKLKVNAFSKRDEELNLSTNGAIINVVTTSAGVVSGDGLISDIEVTDNEHMNFKMAGNKLNFVYEKIENLFFNLKFDMNIEEMIVSDSSMSNQELFRLDNAHYTINQQLSQSSPYIKQTVGIANLTTDLVPLKSLDFNTEIAGFSIDYLLANANAFKNLKTGNDVEAWLQTQEFVTMMRETLVPDTSLSLETNAATTEGNADAAIKLWFAGNGSADGYTGMATTGDLARAIAGTASIKADKSALMSTPLGEMLNDPIAQIYLKITNDTVSVDAKLQELLLTINEQILPIELMAGELLQMPLETLLEL